MWDPGLSLPAVLRKWPGAENHHCRNSLLCSPRLSRPPAALPLEEMSAPVSQRASSLLPLIKKETQNDRRNHGTMENKSSLPLVAFGLQTAMGFVTHLVGTAASGSAVSSSQRFLIPWRPQNPFPDGFLVLNAGLGCGANLHPTLHSIECSEAAAISPEQQKIFIKSRKACYLPPLLLVPPLSWFSLLRLLPLLIGGSGFLRRREANQQKYLV